MFLWSAEGEIHLLHMGGQRSGAVSRELNLRPLLKGLLHKLGFLWKLFMVSKMKQLVVGDQHTTHIFNHILDTSWECKILFLMLGIICTTSFRRSCFQHCSKPRDIHTLCLLNTTVGFIWLPVTWTSRIESESVVTCFFDMRMPKLISIQQYKTLKEILSYDLWKKFYWSVSGRCLWPQRSTHYLYQVDDSDDDNNVTITFLDHSYLCLSSAPALILHMKRKTSHYVKFTPSFFQSCLLIKWPIKKKKSLNDHSAHHNMCFCSNASNKLFSEY